MKRLPNHCLLATLLLLISFAAVGCKDLQEVDALNLVLAVGIDQTPDQRVRVSVEVVDPTGARGQASGGGGKRQSATFVREQSGETVEQAIDKFDENVARKLFLSHNSVVVFGKTYADHGIDRALDYLERNRSLRRNQLFVVTDGTAADLLNASGKPELYAAVAIRALVDQGVKKGVAVNSTQLRVIREYLRPSHSPTIAYVTSADSHICQCGVGLFDGGQYKGHVVSRDAQALLLFIQDTEQTEVVLPCEDAKSSQTDVGDTFRMLSTHTDVVPIVHGRDVQFLVRVRGRAEVERLCPGSRPTTASYQKWESNLASDMQHRMQNMFEQLQKTDVDSVQFGDVLFERQPTAWRQVASQWKTIFPTIKVKYDIQIQLLRNGLASKSPDTEYSPQGLPPSSGQGGPVS
ncbi:Ger(x)C family spore germination protein [Alicyclobacillus sp. ALC3]|uniref:Ger(x)C family spore germination protein n=1 Tax=Alicyclobacillus sp. ALC3 TaxID=2796143 RepID=UPI0023791FEF|nr:Ger(x)C family spore germination protein [Alicyclobacillus sp. ALC3]WDL96067.1 Ger(x)C family spore germination protein [Alicyclobacillus sp. ALC3]